MTLNIRQQLVSSRTQTSAGVNARKYITIHETANTGRGADAQAHAKLQSNGNSRSASWHWQVDDKEAIQSFPHTVRCWHAGNTKGNSETIGVEICVNSDGDYTKAVANATELVAKIMKDEGIPLANVVQHNYWSGKNCPTNLRSGAKGINWAEFKRMVERKSKGGNRVDANIKYEGKAVKGFIEDGRTYVQVRDLADVVGLKIAYDAKSKTVTLRK